MIHGGVVNTNDFKVGFSLATYNMGIEGDRRNLEDKEVFSKTFSPQAKGSALNAQAYVAKNLPGAASVFALQEFESESRLEMQALKDKGYVIIKSDQNIDVAIAIDPTKFQGPIENRSFAEKGVAFALAVAVDKATGKKVAIASIHVSGFALETIESKLVEKGEGRDDALRNCERTIDKIMEFCQDCDQIVIGGDLNASREDSPEHFEAIEAKGAAVFSAKTHTSKAVNPNWADKYTDRNLDHIIVYEKPIQSNLLAKVSSLVSYVFRKDMEVTTKGKFEPNFDPKKSYSDHVPVYLNVPLEKPSSQEIPREMLDKRMAVQMKLSGESIDASERLGFWIDPETADSEEQAVYLPEDWSLSTPDEEGVSQVVDEQNVSKGEFFGDGTFISTDLNKRMAVRMKLSDEDLEVCDTLGFWIEPSTRKSEEKAVYLPEGWDCSSANDKGVLQILDREKVPRGEITDAGTFFY